MRKSFKVLADSTQRQYNQIIKNERSFVDRRDKAFPYNSYYINRSLGHFSQVGDHQHVGHMKDKQLLPHCVEVMKKTWNERTFCASLNILYHSKSLPQGNQDSSNNDAKLLADLEDIFYNNIDHIEKPNTIFSTLKKFGNLDVKIPPETLEKIGNKSIETLKSDNYSFADYGSSVGFMLRALLNFGLRSNEFGKKINKLILDENRKMMYFHILGAFNILGLIPNVLTPADISQYFELFLLRKRLFTLNDITKVVEGLANYVKTSYKENLPSQENLNEYLTALQELIKPLEIGQNSLVTEDLLNYILTMAKLEEIESALNIQDKSVSEGFQKVRTDLRNYWQKVLGESQINSEVLYHLPRVVDLLNLLQSSPLNEEWVSASVKKTFIESLIFTMDVRYSEGIENFELLGKYLETEKEFIAREKLNCGIRFFIYERIKKNPKITKLDAFKTLNNNDEDIRSAQSDKFYENPIFREHEREELL